MNKVRLTAKAHFVAHLLLIKMTDGIYRDKAISAIRQMRRASRGQERYIPSGKIFEMVRALISNQQKERMVRLLKDPEYRLRQKEGTRKYNSLHGSKEKRRAAALKGIADPVAQKNRQAALLRRPKHSEETKRKMRESYAKRHGVAKKYLPPKEPKWIIISPRGEIFKTENYSSFCKQYNLDAPTLALTYKMGGPSPSLQRNRRDTSEARRNTIGWELRRVQT